MYPLQENIEIPIELPTFNIGSFLPEHVKKIKTRLILLNTKPGQASEYIVTAFPENAKEKFDKSGYTVSTWPEVVIGIIVANSDEPDRRRWDLHPTLKSGRGWRKRSVWTVQDRNAAARFLLRWTATENEKSARRGS